jgi:hypothetical protein
MAGLCAAIAAARHGARVALMHDRPVLGGNASSECRVHICGADRHNQIPNLRETGILEEIRLENLRWNPNREFSTWDTVLYDRVVREPNITLLLNCSCLDAQLDGARIRSVTGWQLTTEVFHRVEARVFLDCSGDGVLAPLCDAPFRMGREARSEYGESIAPEVADLRTMGMTCLFQGRLYDSPQTFVPPPWARRFESCSDLPYGAARHHWWRMGYWWLELGGEYDSIRDTERLRHELLRIVYGVWDHIKNRCQWSEEAACWGLEWVQFLPAKRESRRYVGAHVLTQGDVESEGRFEDVVAYGGWTMDDHHPAGFESVRVGAPATVFHPAPAPFGIPLRSLYSATIENLMFAGRNASCTHAAMSSTRVMGTGCSMGQAAGTAAALAVGWDVAPAGVLGRVSEVQQALLWDDCYLPWQRVEVPAITAGARLQTSQGDGEPLRDGVHRPVGGDLHAWTCSPGDWAVYLFEAECMPEEITLVLDSGLDQQVALSLHQDDRQLTAPPGTLPHDFRVECLVHGAWQEVERVTGNHQRLVRIRLGDRSCAGVRWTLDRTWGAERSRVYAFYAGCP